MAGHDRLGWDGRGGMGPAEMHSLVRAYEIASGTMAYGVFLKESSKKFSTPENCNTLGGPQPSPVTLVF